MENKIQVAEARVTGDWLNIKTNDGTEMSCMLSKCPKIKAQVEGKTAPFDIEGKTVEKNGKIYVWDLDEKKPSSGGFKGQPKNEKLITAQSCMGYAVDYHIGTKQAYNLEELKKTAEALYNWCLTKGGVV